MGDVVFTINGSKFVIQGKSILRDDFIISILFDEIETGKVEPITNLESKFHSIISAELQENLPLYKKVLFRYKKLSAFI